MFQIKDSWQALCFAFSSLIIMAAIHFDGFWHVNMGRESLFILPHLILYSGLVFLFILFYVTKATIPKFTWILIILIVVSAPFDEWWHNNFGVEQINDILIVWSPPHLIVELSLIGLFAIVMQKLIIQNGTFSITLQWAVISSLVLFILIPFDLLSPYRVLGVYGGLINLIVLGILAYSYLKFKKRYLLPLSIVMFVLSIPLYLGEGSITNLENYHEHLPLLTLTIVSLTPALLVDVFCSGKSNFFKVTCFLLAYVGIFLGAHVFLIEGYQELWVALPVYGIIILSGALLVYKISKKGTHQNINLLRGFFKS